MIGCELGGALKNVIAIACGMGDGMGVGDNTRAAVITRGLAELTRLGVAMGGESRTLAGLAGLGDLVATCASRQSRNRFVGEQLGKGRKIAEIIDEMHMVAEGVRDVAGGDGPRQPQRDRNADRARSLRSDLRGPNSQTGLSRSDPPPPRVRRRPRVTAPSSRRPGQPDHDGEHDPEPGPGDDAGETPL